MDAKEPQNVSGLNNNQPHVLPGFFTAGERDSLLALSMLAHWVDGRQNTGYQKLSLEGLAPQALIQRSLTLFSGVTMLGYDCYLLRYPVGSEILEHVDPPLADGLRHLRLNVILKQSIVGGALFINEQEIMLREGDAVLFWPDLQRHRVSRIIEGERLLWSIGCNYLCPSTRD